jgi:phage baseplate assembly protein gpV
MADDPRRRPLNLDPGEVAVGNYLTGDYVHFKADGSVVVQTAGAVTVNAGSVAINADTTINGDLTVTGDVSAQNATIAQTTTTGTIVFTQTGQTINVDGDIIVVNGDVTADGISLKTHVHSGVTSGGSNTGAPVP